MKLEPGFYLQQVLVRRDGTLERSKLIYPDGSQLNDDPLHYHSGAEAKEARDHLISQSPEAYKSGVDSRCDISILEVIDRTHSRRQRGEMGGRKTLSVNGAMEKMGVSRRTIHNWLQSGKVEYVRTPGGAPRIFEDTLYKSIDVPNGGVVYSGKAGRAVSIEKAAETAGVSRRTIYHWIEVGKINPVRTASGTLRIFEDELHGKG